MGLIKAAAAGCQYLVFDGEVDEVGVYQHLVGWPQLGVVLEEHG